jgi:hypothetical protein
MMSKYFFRAMVVLCILAFPVQPAQAGPFGLSMGMKISDFKGTLKEIRPFIYQTTDVPKKHSAFAYYILRFGPKCGLYYIKAIGSDISTNAYGKEVSEAFDGMEEKLKSVYGPNKRVDYLAKDSIWTEPRDWMSGLVKGDRVLSAMWRKEDGSQLKDDLETVYLGARGANRSTGYIVVEYYFSNQEKCAAEISAVEDGAL